MFVKINNKIIDLKKLEREQLLLKKILQYEFHETLTKYGFVKKRNKYIHEELLLECQVLFKKQEYL